MSELGARSKIHIRRLREAIDQIPQIARLAGRVLNPEFESWQASVKQSLATIFGPKHDYTRRFQRLSFWLVRMSPGGARAWTAEDEELFQSDLHVAQQVIREALEEADLPEVHVTAGPSPATTGIPAIVINVNNVLSQATTITLAQVLGSPEFQALPDGVREQAAVHARDLDSEIRGTQRWPVLAKSLDALRGLGKGAYEKVALPLLLDMLKKQAGL